MGWNAMPSFCGHLYEPVMHLVMSSMGQNRNLPGLKRIPNLNLLEREISVYVCVCVCVCIITITIALAV